MGVEPRTRKLPGLGLGRRVRARADPEPEEESPSQDSADEDGSSDNSEVRNDDDSSEEQDEEGSDSGSESEEERGPQVDISSVSFGALAKAQAAVSSSGKRKRDQAEREEVDDSRQAEQAGKSGKGKGKEKAKRSSKHAPTEMSSKRPVTRRREIVSTPAIASRDPRFDPALGGPRMDEATLRRNYAFLDQYRDDEIRKLRAATKDPKSKLSEPERAALQRKLKSMESRRQADQRKDQERKILQDHRRREKELVSQGKKPFYLKRSEQKKMLLMDQFAGMKKRQVDRAIERKRKKIVGKEKKELPMMRRERASE